MSNQNQQKLAPNFRKMYQLAKHYLEASRLLDEQARGEDWGCSAPRLLVDSFAVELLLKCLFVMDTDSKPPRGHDWEKLFEALTPHSKNAIREAFDRLISSNPVLSRLDVINPEASKTTDFKRSLKAAKNTFDNRRYLYESQSSTEWFYTHLIRDAIYKVASMDIRLGLAK